MTERVAGPRECEACGETWPGSFTRAFALDRDETTVRTCPAYDPDRFGPNRRPAAIDEAAST